MQIYLGLGTVINSFVISDILNCLAKGQIWNSKCIHYILDEGKRFRLQKKRWVGRTVMITWRLKDREHLGEN